MPHRLSSVAVLLALAACSSSSTITTVDSCASQTGTCADVQIHDASPTLGVVDSLEVSLTGAVTKRGAVQFPSGIAALPASIALLLPDAGGSVTVTVGAVHAGRLVGLGSAQLTATAGQHSSSSITLAAVCASGACGTGAHCVLDSDCASNTCDPASLTCTPATSSGAPSAATSIVSAPVSAAPGVAFHVTLQAKDAAGTQLTSGGATVVFTAVGGTATLGTTVDNGNGTYSASATAPAAGTVTIGATLNGATVTSTAMVAVRASSAATHLGLSAQTQQTSHVAFAVTVNALDSGNNAATSYAGTLHFTSSDSAATLPSDTAVSSGTGTATIQGIALVTAGSQTLTIADASNSAISGSISITVLDVSTPVIHYALTAPSQVTSGATFSVIVKALDASNNTATGYSGTMHFASSDSAATLPADSTLSGSSESATLSVQLVTAGTQTVTATDTSNSSISGSVSVSVLAAATSCVITAPASVLPNGSGTASVTAVSGLTYQWAITNATFSAPNSGTLASGTSVSFTAGTATPITLTCVASNSAGVQAASVSKNIAVTAPQTLSIAIVGQDPAYSADAGTVQAGDAPLTLSTFLGVSTPVAASWASVSTGTLTSADAGSVSSADSVQYNAPPNLAAETTQPITASAGSNTATATLTVVPYGTWSNWTMPPDSPTNYTDKGNGTVLDNVTGLLWQQQLSSAQFSWGNATLHCKGLMLGGQSGWRLPSVLELISLVDYGAQPAVNGTYFPSAPSYYHWTATPSVANAGYYWLVEFADGSTAYGDPSTSYDVRCVR